MQYQPPGGRAPLTGGSDGAEDHRPDGEIQVRVGHHDHCIVAAKLEDRAARPFRERDRDALPEAARACRLDQRETRVRKQRLPDHSPPADGQTEGALGFSAPRNLVEDLLHSDGNQRSEARWLPDDGVATHQCQRPPPAGYRDREVECGYDADHAERMPLLDQLVISAFGRNNASE